MYADNAVLAKVRALYGRRLTADDYRQLLLQKSVGEVAAYLKGTAYAQTLREVREDLVHRGQLENLVCRHRDDILRRILKYEAGDSVFPRLYAMENEVRQLLSAIRMLNAGSIEGFILTMPSYLNKYLSFDLFRLAKITGFDDLLEAVRHSEYYNILGPFRPLSGGGIDIPACEAALLAHSYQKELDLVGERYRGGVREALGQLITLRIDLHNIMVLLRLKRFFHFSPDEIRRQLIPVRTSLPRRLWEHLLAAETAESALELLSSSRRTARYFSTGGEVEAMGRRMLEDRNRRVFRFTLYPVAALMSYMLLLELEGNNLVNIIEGIRYALPSREIERLLIY